MKRLVLVAMLAGSLAACGDAAEESDDPAVAEEVAAAPDAAADAAGTETRAGTYEYDLDGKATTAVLMPDGTYNDSQDGKIVESGLWEERDDGKVCFDPEGADTLGTCYTVGETGPDGTFVATADDGTALTIKKTG